MHLKLCITLSRSIGGGGWSDNSLEVLERGHVNDWECVPVLDCACGGWGGAGEGRMSTCRLSVAEKVDEGAGLLSFCGRLGIA